MIDRYDVWGRPWGLHRMFDRWFEDALLRPSRPANGTQHQHPMNVYEEGDALMIEAPMPGVKPEDIQIGVERGILTIRAQAQQDDERQSRRYVMREHWSGGFARSLRLPAWADADAAEATFQHGVLRLRLPKAEAARPRKVPIEGMGRAAVAPAKDAHAEAIDAHAETVLTTPAPTAAAPESSTEQPAANTPAQWPSAARSSGAPRSAPRKRPAGRATARKATREPAR